MIYAGLVLLTVAVVILLLSIRIRFVWSEGSRWLFVGLGRSGLAIDIATHIRSFKLFGVTVRRFPSSRDKERELREKKVRKPVRKKPPEPASKPRRVRSWQLALKVLPSCAGELIHYLICLLKAAAIEEVEGEIRGGFESPDLTGVAYGYYEAALAMVPSVSNHFHFRPDWYGPSFSASARFSVALPVYKFLWRTAILIWRLPLRNLFKLAIGSRKGV